MGTMNNRNMKLVVLHIYQMCIGRHRIQVVHESKTVHATPGAASKSSDQMLCTVWTVKGATRTTPVNAERFYKA